MDDSPPPGQDHAFYVLSTYDNRRVRFKCLAPVRYGDICCFVDGTSWPSIVRPSGDHCRLIVSALHNSVSVPITDTKMPLIEALVVWDLSQGHSQSTNNNFDLEAFLSKHAMTDESAQKPTGIPPKDTRVANISQIHGLMSQLCISIDHTQSLTIKFQQP